jgi:uncharacterized membrane protein
MKKITKGAVVTGVVVCIVTAAAISKLERRLREKKTLANKQRNKQPTRA